MLWLYNILTCYSENGIIQLSDMIICPDHKPNESNFQATGLSFGHLVSLTGAFSGTLMQFLFPAACYLKCFKDSLSRRQRIGVWLLAICGAIFGALATYVTLVEMFS